MISFHIFSHSVLDILCVFYTSCTSPFQEHMWLVITDLDSAGPESWRGQRGTIQVTDMMCAKAQG